MEHAAIPEEPRVLSIVAVQHIVPRAYQRLDDGFWYPTDPGYPPRTWVELHRVGRPIDVLYRRP